jgi:hypothetical protein
MELTRGVGLVVESEVEPGRRAGDDRNPAQGNGLQSRHVVLNQCFQF